MPYGHMLTYSDTNIQDMPTCFFIYLIMIYSQFFYMFRFLNVNHLFLAAVVFMSFVECLHLHLVLHLMPVHCHFSSHFLLHFWSDIFNHSRLIVWLHQTCFKLWMMLSWISLCTFYALLVVLLLMFIPAFGDEDVIYIKYYVKS